jgi:chemotaxis protein CheC
MLHTAMVGAAQNLTILVGRPISLSSLDVETVPLDDLMALSDDSKSETVGVYLLLTDEELSGEAIIILQPEEAMLLVDWLLEEPPGTTGHLDDLATSALAELGNQALSSFLNSLADTTGIILRLSPPAVVVDTMPAIFQSVAMAAATISDELLIVKTSFISNERSLKIQFWLIPDVVTITPVSIATKQWQWNKLT